MAVARHRAASSCNTNGLLQKLETSGRQLISIAGQFHGRGLEIAKHVAHGSSGTHCLWQ